ncbi:hypothetical protein GSI_14462 [Ganoderma sinense ZZ0214-1]|uniref:Uncharacterized protein n=1 Tax=Ganoderma sinense ZZ0214-1 TaxID=1077348 RepID=A0A2G8RNR9_9APHY|nr:hypothetical protein GSI_14462 [Ganoderma sinense ZZ0214-1]
MSVPPSQAPIASSPKSQRARNLTVSKRHTRKCAQNPKFLNILPTGERPATAYFMSSDRKSVDGPPMEELLKKLPPLQVGDLYCHKTPSVTLIWIYVEDKAKKERFWERIDVGYVRELDGRMLSLTASGNPNFVGDEWANKRQNTEEKRRKKGKGKQVEEVDDDDTDELESEDDE